MGYVRSLGEETPSCVCANDRAEVSEKNQIILSYRNICVRLDDGDLEQNEALIAEPQDVANVVRCLKTLRSATHEIDDRKRGIVEAIKAKGDESNTVEEVEPIVDYLEESDPIDDQSFLESWADLRAEASTTASDLLESADIESSTGGMTRHIMDTSDTVAQDVLSSSRVTDSHGSGSTQRPVRHDKATCVFFKSATVYSLDTSPRLSPLSALWGPSYLRAVPSHCAPVRQRCVASEQAQSRF